MIETPAVDTSSEPLIDSDEVAKCLGFAPLTIRRMAHRGQLPAFKFPFGKTGKFFYRFRRSDLVAYIAAHRQEGE
jgi:excisionase family DNA binding protein